MQFNFNPRPREEGDCERFCFASCFGISIHALVKRATYVVNYHVAAVSYFNPRPREEGDLLSQVTSRAEQFISIHALVKRATLAASY